jgi:two-component system, NtrC family, response regulator AtoC
MLASGEQMEHPFPHEGTWVPPLSPAARLPSIKGHTLPGVWSANCTHSWRDMRKSKAYESDLPPLDLIFGNSAPMKQLRERFVRIAQSPFPVLITGESGTGKEVFAHLLHRMSRARNAPFVKVSCPAIPTGLLETELFGYEKGAFTDASVTKRGRIELADGGVLFLDEIGDLAQGLQAKLLQVLQDGTFCRLGAQADRRVAVRIISATNADLRVQVNAGAFREDIFYRMNAFRIELLPLRQRMADLPDLIEYLLERHTSELGYQIRHLSRQVMDLMKRYDWPGNIRELENMVRRYAILGSEESIASELARGSHPSLNAEIYFDPKLSLKQITKRAVRDLEHQIILQALQRNHWNRKRTASVLRISYRSLFYKMRDAGFAKDEALNPAPGECDLEQDQRIAAK